MEVAPGYLVFILLMVETPAQRGSWGLDRWTDRLGRYEFSLPKGCPTFSLVPGI